MTEPRKNRAGNRRGTHPNSKASLEPGAGQWRPGGAPVMRSGLRSRKPPAEVIDPILDQVIENLSSRVPVRDEAGEVPAWLREMCWSAAIKKLQVTRCARFLAQHDEIDERGRWRPENDALVKATESYERALERLAMTVPSHMRAGLDFQRKVSLAEAMSEPDPQRRADLMREAGVDARKTDDG
jgi:hypothetical protein